MSEPTTTLDGHLRKELDDTQAELKIARQLLWLRHGCPSWLLYGDDGEMQCPTCLIDFRRTSFREIDQIFRERGLQGLAGALAELKSTRELHRKTRELHREPSTTVSCFHVEQLAENLRAWLILARVEARTNTGLAEAARTELKLLISEAESALTPQPRNVVDGLRQP